MTLCDPIDGSTSGSPVPGILQARALEWVAISFSNAWKWKVKVKSLSHVWLLATPWTAAYQAPPSIGFSRQEYWSGVPLPSPKWGRGDPKAQNRFFTPTLSRITEQWEGTTVRCLKYPPGGSTTLAQFERLCPKGLPPRDWSLLCFFLSLTLLFLVTLLTGPNQQRFIILEAW